MNRPIVACNSNSDCYECFTEMFEGLISLLVYEIIWATYVDYIKVIDENE